MSVEQFFLCYWNFIETTWTRCATPMAVFEFESPFDFSFEHSCWSMLRNVSTISPITPMAHEISALKVFGCPTFSLVVVVCISKYWVVILCKHGKGSAGQTLNVNRNFQAVSKVLCNPLLPVGQTSFGGIFHPWEGHPFLIIWALCGALLQSHGHKQS